MFKSTNNVVGSATIHHLDGDIIDKDIPVEGSADGTVLLISLDEYNAVVITVNLNGYEVVLARKTE